MKFRSFSKDIVLLLSIGCFSAIANAQDHYLEYDLQNPDFRSGLKPTVPGDIVACPMYWNCGGSPSPGATAYSPTNAEFPTLNNGLPYFANSPAGNNAVLCPTLVSGSCVVSQSIPGLTYQAGVTYHLTLFVGTPKVMPFDRFGNVDDKSPAVRAQRITVYFVGNGNAQMKAVDVAPPPPGQWTSYDLQFNAGPGQIGQNVGVMIFANSTNYGPVAFGFAIGDD